MNLDESIYKQLEEIAETKILLMLRNPLFREMIVKIVHNTVREILTEKTPKNIVLEN